MSVPIILIIAAGERIGTSTAAIFSAKGYRVAVASRTDHSIPDALYIQADLTKIEAVPNIFETVKSKLGDAPSVVVYNAALRRLDTTEDPLSDWSLENYQLSTTTNNTSVFLALQQSVLGFRTLDASASKTFIITGNKLSVINLPGCFSFGISKAATAYAIRYLVEQGPYVKDGIKFYYADQRVESGAPVFNALDGPTAADEYLKLAEQKTQGSWYYTYVKGVGYKRFEEDGWSPPK